MHAARSGHTVISFEPSPSLYKTFQRRMLKHSIPLSVVEIPVTEQERLAVHEARQHETEGQEGGNGTLSNLSKIVSKKLGQLSNAADNNGDASKSNIKVVIPRDESDHPRVYLLPFALSHQNGQVPFYESACKDDRNGTSKCGKTNRIVASNSVRDSGRNPTTMVNTFRLDDLELPAPHDSIWFVKIDVEGHEVDVIRGGRNFFKNNKNIQYIAVEFSANGRKGTKWGTELLDEIHNVGFTCFHLRGFGECHDSRHRSPSMRCNYPFEVDGDPASAPNFKQYTKVFEMTDKNINDRPRMSDLMCKRRS